MILYSRQAGRRYPQCTTPMSSGGGGSYTANGAGPASGVIVVDSGPLASSVGTEGFDVTVLTGTPPSVPHVGGTGHRRKRQAITRRRLLLGLIR
jgi:hypothetical protein